MSLILALYNKYNLYKFSIQIEEMDLYRGKVASFSDAALKVEFERLKQNQESEYHLLPKVYCVVEECFKRCLGIQVYNEQLLAAIAMHEGFTIEMKTGEGKTIAACFTAILNSIYGKVYIVTINDYIAQRDYLNMKKAYDMLGIECSVNYSKHKNKKSVYQADIIYTSSSELAFDYLINEFLAEGEKVNIPLDFVILDEIDFILLDNATSYFTVSGGGRYSYIDDSYVMAKEICKGFKGIELKKESTVMFSSSELCKYDDEWDFVYSKYDNSIYITERGHRLIEGVFKSKLYVSRSSHLYRAFLDTLFVNMFYQKGKDYIVKDGKIVLINRENGRLMPDSELEKGLQTALQLKENVRLTGYPVSENSISYQVLFGKFKKVVGMSGTVEEAEKELSKVLGIPVAYIPRHSKLMRNDHPLKCFKTLEEKYTAVLNRVMELNKKGQPILLVTGSPDEATVMCKKLEKMGISATLLEPDVEGRDVEQAIIDSAGKFGMVTVTTNMAGRSTDIVPGKWALDAGGLFVISLQHYYNSRIDEQLRGRAGRQGQPGGCQFIVSMQDDIWKYTDGRKYEEYCNVDDERFYSDKHQRKLEWAIKSVQSEVSYNNMNLRKRLVEFDIVMEKHREVIMKSRARLLETEDFIHVLEQLVDYCINSGRMADFDMEGLKDKVERLGTEVSQGLYGSVVNYAFNMGYMPYRKSLEYIRNTIYIRMYNSRDVLQQFIEVSSECLDEFKLDLAQGIVDMFSKAEIQRESRAG